MLCLPIDFTRSLATDSEGAPNIFEGKRFLISKFQRELEPLLYFRFHIAPLYLTAVALPIRNSTESS